MRRVRSFAFYSIFIFIVGGSLMAACTTAAPVPTVVPSTATSTHTITPTASLTPTLTQAPTTTVTPTPRPTFTPTPEDFSDLQPCKNMTDARYTYPCKVTHDDIVSGRLIRMAREMSEPFDSSVKPANISLDDDNGMVKLRVYINRENPSCGIVYVFNYERNWYAKYFLVVEKFKNKDGSEGYLQFLIPNYGSGIGPYLSQLSRQNIIMPEYSWYQSEEDIMEKEYENLLLDDEIILKFRGHIQLLLDQWLETGNIPEELSEFPLETHHTTSYYSW